MLASDPCFPKILDAGPWWQERIVNAEAAYQLNHLPALLAFAVDQLIKIVLTE